jgi:transcriptional regulator with XRE-family HTH domain
MLDKAELGKRIKKVRESKHLTLKNIEAAAGISATHISEIERGKTSPTLGALMKISKALGKDPAYFIEEEELNDVSLVTLEDRVVEKIGNAGTMERLSTSIPGGKLQARLVKLEPGKMLEEHPHSHYGNEAVLVLSGKVLFTVNGEKHEVDEGDAVYYSALEEHSYENVSSKDVASILWVSTERDVS